MARGRIRFDCTENDNHLIYEWEEMTPEDDNDEGQVLVGDELEKEWTVIGMIDLKNAMKKFEETREWRRKTGKGRVSRITVE